MALEGYDGRSNWRIAEVTVDGDRLVMNDMPDDMRRRLAGCNGGFRRQFHPAYSFVSLRSTHGIPVMIGSSSIDVLWLAFRVATQHGRAYFET